MALERWGNRIPQLACEVLRPIGRLESDVRAITIIPGASEHGLDPEPVRERLGRGEDRLLNRNNLHGASDWTASLDELKALCPRLERAALVVSWFGDDLRVGQCRLQPGIEISERDETEEWHAGGVGRDGARLVSRIGGGDGGPAFGGTPSDRGVLRAIADLEGAGAEGHLLSVHPDGRTAGQWSPRPLWRGRAGAVSLAWAHDAGHRGGARGLRGPDGGGTGGDRGVLRDRAAAGVCDR